MKNLSSFDTNKINPWQYFYHLERNFSHLQKLCSLKKKITVIKLERLHKNNFEVMKKFCTKYQLSFENILQKSTFHGKLWWGDQVSKKDLNGINKDFKNNIELRFIHS